MRATSHRSVVSLCLAATLLLCSARLAHAQVTEEGVITTVGAVGGYASGAYLAGTINAGTAVATIGATVGSVISGVGAFVAAYTIPQYIFNTVGTDLANDIHTVLFSNGVNDSGRVMNGYWEVSDLVYRSDLTFSLTINSWYDDWFCGEQGCLCYDSDDCYSEYWCVNNECTTEEGPPMN